MGNYKVAVVGATGMVGQRFVSLLEHHPWFELVVVAASQRSAGQEYGKVVEGRWAMPTAVPPQVAKLVVKDALAQAEEIAAMVDFIFCAIDLDKEATLALEERYAKLECPVISNNSANRGVADVPMIIPEINPDHSAVIVQQRKRLGTKHGFIAVKSNCSLQSYVPALHPLRQFGLKGVLACTYQAISGAGKTFETYPEIVGNVIPFIGGEEEKSQNEPLKIWGTVTEKGIENATTPPITAQCFRVAVQDGHTAAVFVKFANKPTKEQILQCWQNFKGEPQTRSLPSAPKQFLHYFTEDNRPQPKLDSNLEQGMAVSVGRLRPDESGQYDYKFACLSHNTVRGAAGGAVLMAELLADQGYFTRS